MSVRLIGTPRALLGLAALLIGGVFAYGYWHTVTHAIVRPELRDSSGRTLQLLDAELMLFDGAGRTLARLVAEGGVLYIIEPASFSCRDVERRAMFEIGGQEVYARCFERQTRWTAEWVERVSHASVTIGSCAWGRLPVLVDRHPTGPADWWLFWPLPHMGGSPYTSYTVTVIVDPQKCAPR